MACTQAAGSVDLYQCQLAEANSALETLKANKATFCKSRDEWIYLCNNQNCDSTAIATREMRVSQCADADTAISNKQNEINAIQKSLAIAQTAFDAQANKSPDQIAKEQAATAKQKNYKNALIWGGVIVLAAIIGWFWYRSKKK